MPQRFPSTVLTAVVLGCGSGSGTDDPGFTSGGPTSGATATNPGTTGSATDSGGTSPTATGTNGDSNPSTTGTTGSSGVATTGVRFDLPVPDAAPPNDTQCEKVDLLFVVDDSQSMQYHQASLVASFPGFVAGMRAELQGVSSYHVGVTASDVYGAPYWLFECEDTGPEACQERGALVTSTVGGGEDASNEVCTPYAEGGRYMTDQDDLATKFACAATVGTDGCYTERPMAMMLAAVSPDINGPGGCSEDFLRPDALLVVVIITDENDESEGDPPDWFAELVAIKGGHEKNIAMVSIIIGSASMAGCSGQSQPPADRIETFTNMFTHGVIGDICAPSYDALFTDAVSVVVDACGDFVPPEG